jgi:hypothetical protein
MADNADPFVTGLFGGLPKTATSASETYSEGTTVRGSRGGTATLLLVPATNSSSEQPRETRRSRGDSHDTGATGKMASNAPSFATKARTSRRSLSDRLTPSLMSRGLVCGTTPSSTRKQSGQPILVLALDMPGGGGAARLKRDSSYSSATPIKDTDNG